MLKVFRRLFWCRFPCVRGVRQHHFPKCRRVNFGIATFLLFTIILAVGESKVPKCFKYYLGFKVICMAKSIVLEGPEGVGKTTQASLLGYLLEEYAKLPILRVREPGGTPVGEAIRSVLFTSEFRNMDATTNVLLFSASRNEVLVNKVKPWLEENPTGISIGDRDWWSTIALQASDGADPGYIEATQKPFMWYPNRTYYLDLPAEESIVRVRMAKIKEGVRK